MQYYLLREMDTLSGEATLLNLFCLPPEKWCSQKGKNLGSTFFPFGVDSFSEGAGCAGKQTENHKIVSLAKKKKKKK